VVYGLQKPSPLTRYIFDFIFDVLGLPSYEVPPAQCLLYYGDPTQAPAGALVIPCRDSDLIWPETSAIERVEESPGPVFPYDVVASIGRLLTDAVNRHAGPEGQDDHQRLRFVTSFQGRNGIGEIPVVNMYARALGAWLARRRSLSPIPAWPPGRRCAIALSHDVDRIARRSSTLVWPPYALRLSKYENIVAARQRLWHFRQIIRFPRVDDVRLFRKVVSFEAEYGCSSTSFFATRNRFDAHASVLDVQYDIRNQRMRRLLEDLREKGFGIGLHASYRAFESPSRFFEESRTLQQVSGVAPLGLRHHFWHLGTDIDATLAAHEAAGFDYDSSISFNEHLGFRRSVAWPYYPWSETMQRPLRTLQMPVFCMDGNVFYTPSSVEEAVAKISAVIANIKEVGGVGSIDWHSDTASPETPGYEDWGLAYEQLVRMLADDSDVWTTSLEAIVDWFKTRRSQLSEASGRAAN
jgi:hypothetical protein